MDLTSFVIFLLAGAVAGWAASQFVRGTGFGIVGDIATGVGGAVIGGWVLNILGFGGVGRIGALIAAIIGAAVALVVIRILVAIIALKS